MKIRASLGLRLLWTALLVAGCGRMESPQRRPRNVRYTFEPQPGRVIERLGIPSSTSPRVAMSTSGAIYLPAVFGKEHQFGFFMSHNEGDNFIGPIRISAPNARVTAHGEASPNLVLGPTQIYVVWEQQNSSGTELLFTRSLSWGHSFEKPVKVTDEIKPSFNGFSSVAVAPNGDVYVVWLDGRDPQPPVVGSANPGGTFGVYLARSTDQGASLGKNIRIALGACPCCRPSLAFGPHGEVFAAWRKVFPDDIRDIVVSTSHDYGMTFDAPVRVATDNWKISGCPDSGPALAVHENRLYLAWLSEGGSRAGIRLSHSDDGALSFTQPIIASSEVLYPNHPALSVAADGTVLLVFQGRDPKKNEGWSPLAAYLVEASTSGSVSQPFEVPGHKGSVSYPTVSAGNGGRILVAWTEMTDAGSNVVLSRGRESE